jgi:hypothetical protein
MRSLITTGTRLAVADAGLMAVSVGGWFGRHQVYELPPIRVIVTERRTHQLRCRHRRARTSARFPVEMAALRSGPDYTRQMRGGERK